MSLNNRFFEESVEMDLHMSNLGKKLVSAYTIEDNVVITDHVQVYRVKSRQDHSIHLLFAIPKVRLQNGDVDALKNDLFKFGESSHFEYFVRKG
jgi:hypothetical protein